MSDSLRDRMLREMNDKAIFARARDHAYAYVDGVREKTVYPTDQALAGLHAFDEALPERSGDAGGILDLLHRAGSPASVAQMGGRYFGFVNGGVVPAALAVRWLTDFWDQNPALDVMSPVVAKLETICERWLVEVFGLGDDICAGFVGGSSTAIFGGLAAGRHRCFENLGWDINARGLRGAPEVRIVAGAQSHGAVGKAVALLGFGTETVEWIPTDGQGRAIADETPPLNERTIVVLQAGHVSSGAFDPFDEICTKASESGAWVHIDGAFGLWAAASAKLRHLTRGIERANSWSVDGHKTLNAPYDNGILLCSDRDALIHAMQASGSYIAYGEQGDKRDGMLYTPEMSRRARAVEIWAALKYLGREGLDELVYGLHERARQFADELAAAGFRILNDVVFNQVIVACGTETETRRTMEAVQRSGECWVGGAAWHDEAVIRVSVCSWATTPEDVSRSVRAFVTARDRAAYGA